MRNMPAILTNCPSPKIHPHDSGPLFPGCGFLSEHFPMREPSHPHSCGRSRIPEIWRSSLRLSRVVWVGNRTEPDTSGSLRTLDTVLGTLELDIYEDFRISSICAGRSCGLPFAVTCFKKPTKKSATAERDTNSVS